MNWTITTTEILCSFECCSFDDRVHGKWVNFDIFGITSMNSKHLFNSGENLSDEQLFLPPQATQAYSVQDSINKDSCSVVHLKPGILLNILGKEMKTLRRLMNL